MDNNYYCINRDIVCRVEEPEGAIIFSPATGSVKAMNHIGLMLWKALENPCRKRELVEHLLLMCEDVPVDQVNRDVSDFVYELKAKGFLGELIE